MPGKSVLDQYPQYAIVQGDLYLAAAGSSSAIHRLETGLTNLQKVAWAAVRFEYFIDNATMASLAAANDLYAMAITASASTVQGMFASNASIYDMVHLNVNNTPAAATPKPAIHYEPIVHDCHLDPILILPQNIYLFEVFTNAGAVSHKYNQVRIWYREVELTSEDWYDLLQLRMPLGAI